MLIVIVFAFTSNTRRFMRTHVFKRVRLAIHGRQSETERLQKSASGKTITRRTSLNPKTFDKCECDDAVGQLFDETRHPLNWWAALTTQPHGLKGSPCRSPQPPMR